MVHSSQREQPIIVSLIISLLICLLQQLLYGGLGEPPLPRKPPLSLGYALGLGSVYCHKSLARAITITYMCIILLVSS